MANKTLFSLAILWSNVSGLDEHLLKLYFSLSSRIFLIMLISIQSLFLVCKYSLTSLQVKALFVFSTNDEIIFHRLLFWIYLLFIMDLALVVFLLELKSFIILFIVDWLNCQISLISRIEVLSLICLYIYSFSVIVSICPLFSWL